ncbi:MAG: hypothetical protein RLY86_3295 [Pseudomonadota bacterium]|jgi:hypothetical protein
MVKPPADLDAVSASALKPLTLGLLEENARLVAENAELRDEIARLKGLKARPDIKLAVAAKPSGMDKATERRRQAKRLHKRRRGPKKQAGPVEQRIVAVDAIPPGSRFKGYEPFTVQDLQITTSTVCYRRERWLTPDGRTLLAPLPAGVGDHFGPEIKRFILTQYHQGQTTIPRLVAVLAMLGVEISQRQVVRILTASNDIFRQEAQAVLRAGLRHGAWISVDDTGARHQGRNGVCTQMGNDAFTFFATSFSKSRANFLGLLRGGHDDYVLHDAAFAYMRRHHLAGPIIAKLAAHPARHFADPAAWQAHLDALGLTGLKVQPDPVKVATEAALWGAVTAHGFLDGAVIIRSQVTRRKISGTTRSDKGRDCRDAFLGLAKTCQKLGISFWDYLGHRLGAPTREIRPLAELVAARCTA